MTTSSDPSLEISKWLNRVANPEDWSFIEEDNEFVGCSGDCSSAEIASYEAHLDGEGRPNGEGSLTFDTGDYFQGEFYGCLCNREGTSKRVGKGERTIEGRWIEGRLDGFAKETFPGRTDQVHYRKGVRQGFFRQFGPAPLRKDNLWIVGNYDCGKLSGWIWRGLIGGGFLIGPVDSIEQLTGDLVMYLYPDLCTVITGSFKDGHLTTGRMAKVVGIRKEGQIIVPVTAENGPVQKQFLSRDVSTSTRISNSPLEAEPWEAQFVEVRRSEIGDSAGEGLFSKTDIPEGRIIALFNGVRKPSNRLDEYSEYRIRLNGDSDIDIPTEFTTLEKYCATLGHKANHSFTPNGKWTRIDHPRFGLICSITAIRHIDRDQEITVNYGLGLTDAPAWYKHLWVHHCRVKLKMDDQGIREWCERQYAMKGSYPDLPLDVGENGEMNKTAS